MRKDEVHQVLTLGATGRLSRREVIARLAVLGLGSSAIASAVAGTVLQPGRAAAAGRRGDNGVLKLLYWQAPTILNPHLAAGVKDFDASRICLEPLLTVSTAGAFTPVLAAEVPSLANSGLSADGKSVTYKLKQSIKWADDHPFTADDVVFTHRFITNKETGATTYGEYDGIDKVEALNPYTVRITFKTPTPAWYLPFVGALGMVLPKHALENYVGASARHAPFNLKSFGTGPYKVETFRPGDVVIYSINENYRDPNKPAFQQVQIKGGGDAVSAARAVLETGEYDYAWGLRVEWSVLEAMTKAGKGVLITEPGGGVEQIYCNMTDPSKEIDGQRSSVKAPHPFLTDLRVRQALGLALDRETMAKQLHGLVGDPTPNVLTTPSRLNSKNTRMVLDFAKANQLLDEAGWQKGSDGIRQKGGVKMQLTYATSVNTLQQKEQEIVKDGWAKIGMATTLKSVDAGVFFSSSPGNNDTYSHFYTDVQMFPSAFGSPFPSAYMIRFYSGDQARDLAQKENNWSGRNIMRWVNKDFNHMYEQAQTELDPNKNDALWIKMNDLVVNQAISLPLIDRRIVSARARSLDVGHNMSTFDDQTRNIADWRRAG